MGRGANERSARRAVRSHGAASRTGALAPLGVLVVLVGLMGLAGLTACRSTPPSPPPRAEVTTSLDYYPGTPLTRSSGKMPPAIDPAKALSLQIDVFGLDVETDTDLAPLAERIYLVTAVPDGDPILSVPAQLAAARLATGEMARRMRDRLLTGTVPGARRLGTRYGVVARGVTALARVKGRQARAISADGSTPSEGIEIHIYRSADGSEAEGSEGSSPVQVALVTETIRPAADEPGSSPGSSREAGLLDVGPRVASPLMLYLPVGFKDSGLAAMILFIQVESAPLREAFAQRAVVDACERALEARCRSDAEPVPPVLGQTRHPDLLLALDALARPDHRRTALIYLSRATAADLAIEAAFLSDDSILEAIAEAVRKRMKSGEKAAGPSSGARIHGSLTDLAWMLDQEACRALVAYLIEHPGPNATVGLVVRHAGEIGRRPELLRVISDDAKSSQGFRDELVESNEAFLDDPSPAVRIRAHDWLVRHGAVPEGYDPLAPGSERRAALRRAEERAEEEAEEKAEEMAEEMAEKRAAEKARAAAAAGSDGKEDRR